MTRNSARALLSLFIQRRMGFYGETRQEATDVVERNKPELVNDAYGYKKTGPMPRNGKDQ